MCLHSTFAKTFAYEPAYRVNATSLLGSAEKQRRAARQRCQKTKSVVWPPRRRVPGCNKMAIKDAWRFDKSQWALKAGIASSLVLATIIWYALECGPVF